MQWYNMTEQAFIDVWEKYGCPEEIHRNDKSYHFLYDLFKVTKGKFIIDHFSMANYDYLTDLKYQEPYVMLYWKNYDIEKIEDDMSWQIFDYNTYIYSLCNINKLKIVQIQNHLYVMFLPIISTEKEIKNFLGINTLANNLWRKEDNYEEFYSSYTFINCGKKHECFSYQFPFYSFLIHPKENAKSCGFSTQLLMIVTLDDVENRIIIIKDKLKSIDKYDYDEISSCGNVLRRILEYLLKYYCLYKNFSLPKQYGHSLLGELKKHLNNNDDVLAELITQSLITTANELSHDTGKVIEYDDVHTFLDSVNNVYNNITNQMVKCKF